jgi:hypothetical protein
MPGAELHLVGNTAPTNGGPSRAIWHITYNATDHTFANELGWFTSGGASMAPHLIWDPFTGQVAQLFPADSRSLAVKNAVAPDGSTVQTNRTGQYCIQIEIVFTPGESVNGRVYNTVAETPCVGLSGIVAWLNSLGIAQTWPNGVPTGFHRQDVSTDFWLSHGGHYGHNMVPGNDHVDPGPMPNLFTPPPPVETDMPQWDRGRLTQNVEELIPVPNGAAWNNWPNRRLHLYYDEIGNPTGSADVRVALFDGTGWDVEHYTVHADGGKVDVPMTNSHLKVALTTTAPGTVAWALETW